MLRMATDVLSASWPFFIDVIEDSDVTLEQLGAEGFLPQTLSAIEVLTKRPGESRCKRLLGLRLIPIARALSSLPTMRKIWI